MTAIKPVQRVDGAAEQPIGGFMVGPGIAEATSSKKALSHRFHEEVVVLSNVTRTLLWAVILLLLVFNATLLAMLSYTYLGNETPDSLLWFNRIFILTSVSNKFLLESSTTIGVGYAILCAIFAGFALRLVWLSIRKRRFRFGVATFRVASSVSTQTRSSFNFRSERISRFKHFLATWSRLVGVRGPYFEVRLLLDEVFELTSQTVAAYSSSRSISNVYLNISYSIVIFLNSVCSVVFRFIFKNSLVKQRMACLLTDLVLDFIWGTLLPVWMYYPIVETYVSRGDILQSIDTITKSTREIERVLVLSWKAYALSIIPFINALFNLAEIQSILREVSTRTTPAPPSAAVKAITVQTTPAAPTGDTVLRMRYASTMHKHSLSTKVAHGLITLYGFAIVFVTLSANGAFNEYPSHDQFECVDQIHPWFTTKEACIGMRINCTVAGITGTKDELEYAFNLFDEGSVSDLSIVSCPSVELPTVLTKFGRLQYLLFKEVGFSEWSTDVTLTEDSFPDLRTIIMKLIVVNGNIDGLVAMPLSPIVEWLHLEYVDGNVMLGNVGTNWQHLLFFECMWCGMFVFPEAVTHMHQLQGISLVVNYFTDIPDWPARWNLTMQSVWLDGNFFVTELPDSVWRQAATAEVFSLTWTNISVVPDWVPEIANPTLVINAQMSPLCAPEFSMTDALRQLISCPVE